MDTNYEETASASKEEGDSSKKSATAKRVSRNPIGEESAEKRRWFRSDTIGTNSLGVPLNSPWVDIVPESDEARVPQVVVRRPFGKLELAHQHRLQPAAFDHLVCS